MVDVEIEMDTEDGDVEEGELVVGGQALVKASTHNGDRHRKLAPVSSGLIMITAWHGGIQDKSAVHARPSSRRDGQLAQ